MNIQFQPEKFAMPISRASYDDAKKQVLVPRDLIVYNFDDVKEYVCRRLRDSSYTKSCDAYFKDGQGREYIIEFKNQREEDVPRRALRQKAYDSLYLLLLTFAKEKTVEEAARNTTLIIVYNDHLEEDRKAGSHHARSRSFEKMADAVGNLAGKREHIKFGLAYLKGQLYREIYTLDTEDFSRIFVDGVFQK